MENIYMLEAEIEELQKKYWQCFNHWYCEEDLERIQCAIEELRYKLSLESSQALEISNSIRKEVPTLFFERKKSVRI